MIKPGSFRYDGIQDCFHFIRESNGIEVQLAVEYDFLKDLFEIFQSAGMRQNEGDYGQTDIR